MNKLILISGRAEHGKSLAAKIIKQKLEADGKRVVIVPFANYLKFICSSYFGWDGKKNDAGRTILQYVGTDVVRKREPNFWVNAILDFIRVFGDDFDYIISDDCRFINEMDFFNTSEISTITIRVSRFNKDGTEFENSLSKEQRSHVSETELEFYAHDIYLASDTGFDNVEKDVENIMSWIR